MIGDFYRSIASLLIISDHFSLLTLESPDPPDMRYGRRRSPRGRRSAVGLWGSELDTVVKVLADAAGLLRRE
jgi:hypothetical protein